MLAPLSLGLWALATSVDGSAALAHASKLAALGPHPMGSPRASFAAAFVLAEFRAAGLEEVRLQPFEDAGVHGANVVGVLRAPGDDFLILGAHHGTAPDAPGAHEGAGVGVLLEVARVLAQRASRPRTLVFVSFDGAEGTRRGSAFYVRALGSEARHLVAALVVEAAGFGRGVPILRLTVGADPVRPGRHVVAPLWLERAALEGARGASSPLAVGDPLLSWLVQPAARSFRDPRPLGDDLPFLQAGLPAVAVSDSCLTSPYPFAGRVEDTTAQLDAEALARLGRAVVGAVAGLESVSRGADEPEWFVGLGRSVGFLPLVLAGALSLLPGLLIGLLRGGLHVAARVLHAGAFTFLLVRHPVPALAAFLLLNLLGLARRPAVRLAGAVPLVLLLGVGFVAWQRGEAAGVWLAPFELVLGGLTLLLAVVAPPPRALPAPLKKTTRRRT